MRRKLAILAGTLLFGYVAACLFLFAAQRSFIYQPQPPARGVALPTLRLPTDDGDVLVSTQTGSGPDAVLYFGGNGEQVALSLPAVATAYPEHTIYLMNYRGYGGSAGSPSERALFADAVALFDRVRTRHHHVVVVGRSLGSGVATYLASVRPVAAIALVTPYASIEALAAERFPHMPIRLLLLDPYRSDSHAERVTAPTLLIAGGQDRVIPLSSTRQLLAAFPAGVARLTIVPAAGHNSISERPEYVDLLRSAIDRPAAQ